MNEQNLPVPVQHPADSTPAQPAHGGGHDDGSIPHDLPRPGAGTITAVVAAFALLLAALFVVGIVPDRREKRLTRDEAAERAKAKPKAQWAHPIASTGERDVSLPADVTAYQQTALYTRTNGYLKSWKFDLGQHVKQGELMAEIETPEVDAQLEQSRATLEQYKANTVKAQADLRLADQTLGRYVESQRTSPGSVTKEQLDQQQAAKDTAVAALRQAEATVKQGQANVDQLQTQVNFERIVAPFSGTVTARNYDVGALLSPPTSSASSPQIFDLQQTDKLRVFVNVPQGYANNVKAGQTATLEVRNFPGRKFAGKIALTAGAINPNTRTLRVQVDFDNKDGDLFAGAYGQLSLPVTPQQPVMVIRSSALVFNAAGTEVAVLGDDGKTHVRPIVVGRDLGTELQVTSGLSVDDKVIINPGERTGEGAEVEGVEAPNEQPKPTTAPAATQPAEPERQPTPPANNAPAGGATGR